MASMLRKRLKYLRKHLLMSEMTEEFDKPLIYVGYDVYVWELV